MTIVISENQSRVADAIWPWRAAPNAGVADSGATGRRRKRALLESAVGLIAGLAIFFLFGRRAMGTVVICLAATALIGGLFVPPLYEGFQRMGRWLAGIVGVSMTWLLLVPFFYTCFTVARILLLVFGKDPLCRKFPTTEKSYWVARQTNVKIEGYRRQY